MLKKSTRIHLGQLQSPKESLSSTKWRSKACLSELLEEQETAEDGKEFKSVTVDGDLRKYAILTTRGPVTSFLPMYDVFTTAVSGAVDWIF